MTAESKELDEFAEAVIDVKVKPLSEYCKVSITQLECDRGRIKCMLSKAKEMLNKAVNCRKYKWDTNQKPKIVNFWSGISEKLAVEIDKIDDAIRKRNDEIQSNLSDVTKAYDEKYISGWEPEGWKPPEKK